MSKTFKTTELKEVGRVKVSARGLRELADKLDQKAGVNAVVNVMVYLAPAEAATDYPELGYDFNSVSTVPRKVDEKPVIATPEVKTETPKAPEAKTEAPKAEEVKQVPAAETPKPGEAVPAATPVATQDAKEAVEKAKEITAQAEAINKDAEQK